MELYYQYFNELPGTVSVVAELYSEYNVINNEHWPYILHV